MFRLGTLEFASLLATTVTALATPVERGHYLVNSILTCGNCHIASRSRGSIAL
jgi:hypothetical protein